MENVKVKAVVDLKKELAERVASEFDVPMVYTDYHDLLQETEVDIVSIATPTPTHAKIAKDVAETGKHLVIEKPLSIQLNKAKEVVHTIRKQNLKATMVRNYRYFPAVRKVKHKLSQGHLGHLISIQGLAHTYFPNAWTKSKWLYHEGGVLYDYFPHLLDLVLWLLEGEVSSVYARGGTYSEGMDFLTYSQLSLEFKNETICTLDASWLTGSVLLLLRLMGTGGWIDLDVNYDDFYEYHGTPTPIDFVKALGQKTFGIMQGLKDYKILNAPMLFYEKLYNDFFYSIKKNKREPIPIEQGARVVEILDAAVRSINEKNSISVGTTLH